MLRKTRYLYDTSKTWATFTNRPPPQHVVIICATRSLRTSRSATIPSEQELQAVFRAAHIKSELYVSHVRRVAAVAGRRAGSDSPDFALSCDVADCILYENV